MSQPSLFEDYPVLAPSQGSLFSKGDTGQEAVRAYVPNSSDIRRRLEALLDKARRAERMPWSARDARMWQTVFPQMANWLPEHDANKLRIEFAQELNRLQLAA